MGESWKYATICKQTDKIYDVEVYNLSENFKNKLQKYFDKPTIDSLIFKFNNVKGEDIICSQKKIKLISYTKAIEKLKRNHKLSLDKLATKPKYKYVVFFISSPIYFKEYAIIQSSESITRSNSITFLYLLKKYQGNWVYVDILQSSAS